MGIDPVSLAVIGGIGAAVSAGGALETGAATKNADAYKAQVAANNAAIAQQDARFDVQSGETAAFNQGLKTRAAVGSQKASQGASGIDVNTGSAADVRAGTEQTGFLNASTMLSNATKKAYSDEVQANSDTAEGQLDTMAGTQAETAGEIGAAGTLLSGASTVGSSYWKSVQSAPPGPGFVSGL